MTISSDKAAAVEKVKVAPPPPPAGKRGKLPPEWGSERLFKWLGRGPAVLGKGLDRLAKVPVVGVVVGIFSSVWVGIGFLFLLGAYIGVGSGFPGMRAKFEMTDLQFFDAWPMQVILAGLAFTLTLVTLRRIPLTVFKLGVWMVHIGILTLIGGSVWYFSHKLEGSVRIYMNRTVDSYFDATERALYAFRMGEDRKVEGANSTMTPLATLPIFYEHLSEMGNGLDMVMPAGTVGNLRKGLEGAKVRVTGYYPAAEMETAWQVGEEMAADATGDAPNPAVRVSMALMGVSSGQWLFGKQPAGRVLDAPNAPFGMEYLYRPTAEQVADVTAEFKGAAGIVVRVAKLGVNRSYTVEPGQVVKVEGTPYVLTIGGEQELPLISKGYEGATSNSLMVTVVRNDGGKEMTFNRMVLARYPERSPDFVMGADGKQKRIQDRVDNDIQIDFADASRDQFWILDSGEKGMELVHRRAGGSVERMGVEVGKAVSVNVGTVPMMVMVQERAGRMVATQVPRIIPANERQQGGTAMDVMQESIVTLRVENGGWVSDAVYVPFVQFAQIGEGRGSRMPTVVDVPGVGKIGFLFSTTRRALPSAIKLLDFQAVKYEGAMNSYVNFISRLEVTPKDGEGKKILVPQLNDPAGDQGLYYFQAGWAGANAKPEEVFSIIGVGNRPGIYVMMVGAILMVVGIGYSFYVKPVLLRRKKEELARWAAGNGSS